MYGDMSSSGRPRPQGGNAWCIIHGAFHTALFGALHGTPYRDRVPAAQSGGCLNAACQTLQVPVEYKTQLSSSMPPLTPKSPKTPEVSSQHHTGGDGTGLYSTAGLYSTTAAAARLETQLSSGGLPPPAVAQGDTSGV